MPNGRTDFKVLLKYVSSENKENIIMGDFNKDLSLPNFNREWSGFITSLGLRQLVTQLTRVTDASSTLIDHLYSGNKGNLSNVHVAELGISDHYAISCNMKVNFIFLKEFT